MNSRKLCIAFFMSLVLFVTSIPNIVWANQTEVSLNHPEGENLTRLTGLVIGGLDEPAEGKPLDENATVTSENGMSWEIPAFWIDENFETALAYKENISPLLAFYLPEGYTFDGNVLLDDYLTGVFNAIGHVETNYDEATGITFIFGVVNVVYTTVSYGAAGSGARKNYEEPYDDSTDEPDWDPDDLGDFEDEYDDSADQQTEDNAQPDTDQPNNQPANQPAVPVPGDGSSDKQEDPSGKDETRSLYEQFKDAYEGHYDSIDWKQEAERFGGLDQIDWDQMAAVIGYENLRTIYENSNSYHIYITENGGTEEECTALDGKIEASIEKVKPQNDTTEANDETTKAEPKSERFLSESGEKHEKDAVGPDADKQQRTDDVLTDKEDVSADDVKAESAAEETGGTALEGLTEKTDDAAQEGLTEKTDDAAQEGLTEKTDDAAQEGLTEKTNDLTQGRMSEDTDDKDSEGLTEKTGDSVKKNDGKAVSAKEKAAPKAKTPKPEKAAPKEEASKPEKAAPKEEAPKPEKEEPKEEASVPEQPEQKDQKDDSVKEESRTSENETDR